MDTDSLLTSLSENDPDVTEIKFEMFWVRPTVIANVLRTNTMLTKLELKDNAIDDNGFALIANALETNTTLTALSFTYNSIGNNGAIALASALSINDTLVELELQHNHIGNDQVEIIAEALGSNNSLRVLDLRGNIFDDEGVVYIANALKTNTALTLLNLKHNPDIHKVGVDALIAALKENTTRRLVISIGIDDKREFKRLSSFSTQYVQRNRNGRRRAAEVESIFRFPPYAGLGRDAAHVIADLVRASRGEPKWWKPEEDERGTFGVEEEPPAQRRKLGSCIQCFIQDAAFQERDTPSRLFCGRYCQKLHHSRGDFPDVRGMTVEQVLKVFSLKK